MEQTSFASKTMTFDWVSIFVAKTQEEKKRKQFVLIFMGISIKQLAWILIKRPL